MEQVAKAGVSELEGDLVMRGAMLEAKSFIKSVAFCMFDTAD
jgi:hypothetical protein